MQVSVRTLFDVRATDNWFPDFTFDVHNFLYIKMYHSVHNIILSNTETHIFTKPLDATMYTGE